MTRWAAMGVALAIAVVAIALATLLEGEQSTVQMSYDEFRALAATDLDARNDDGVVFYPAETELFAQIRSDPLAWQPLVAELVGDPGADRLLVHGAAATMLDLPPKERADFLGTLLDAASARPELGATAYAFAANTYRGHSMTDPALLAEDSLFDHRGMTEVRAVLERLWRHEALPSGTRDPGRPLHDLFGDWEG